MGCKDHIGVLLLVFLGVCTAQYNTCPPGSARRVQNAFGQSRYVQRGVWHRLSCTEIRPNESLDGVIWFKGRNMDDQDAIRLISFYDGKVIPGRDGFGITPDFGLVIQGVESTDGGRYLCNVEPVLTGGRYGQVDLTVIGDSFPAGTSEVSSTASFHPGRRQTLPCECASQTPDVVYWSTGEGVTTDTQIIGARFSDGATLQIQHGADYSIGRDASLTVNSLDNVKRTQRFWCHVFQSDGTLRNCDTNTQIADAPNPTGVLQASSTSFYLEKGLRQVLPCTSYIPGTPTCEIQWLKLNTTNQPVLNYNLSTNQVESPATGYDLASDFRLVIASAEEDHAGSYRCGPVETVTENGEIQVRIIGDKFPLDGSSAIAGDTVTYEPDHKLSLTCHAILDVPLTTKATLFWSYGALNAHTTTLIGKLNRPDGLKMMSGGGDDCYQISVDGSLIVNNCSRDDDVRYWCHVFPYGGDVIRSYVDSLVKVPAYTFGSPYIVPVVVCVCFLVIALLIVSLLIWMWKRNKQERIPRFDVRRIGEMIRTSLTNDFARIPITPRVAEHDVKTAGMYQVYVPAEMFLNVPIREGFVKYILNSESEIFNDGIQELKSRHVVVNGRPGSGKSTFLCKVALDWSSKRDGALLAEKKLVFPIQARDFIQTGDLGQVVVEHMLPSQPTTMAKSINKYCCSHPSDVALLIDGCNNKRDIDTVMGIMKDQGLLKCSLIMTTTNAEIAQNACKQHNMRHITINGLSPEIATGYVKRILKMLIDHTQGKQSPEEREKGAQSSKPTALIVASEETHGLTSDSPQQPTYSEQARAGKPHKKESTQYKDTIINIFDTPLSNVSAVASTQDSACDSEISSETPTALPTTKQQAQDIENTDIISNLCICLDQDVLPPQFVCLPANLAALCWLSVWTKGEVFRADYLTIGDVCNRLFKYMFEKIEVKRDSELLSEDPSFGYGTRLEDMLTKEQLGVLMTLSKVVMPKISPYYEGCLVISESDFLNVEGGQEALEMAIQMGLLCLDKELNGKSVVKSTEPNADTRAKEKEKAWKLVSDIPLLPTEKEVKMVRFGIGILEQHYIAMYLAHSTESVKSWLENISRNIGIGTSVDKISNVATFACRESPRDREAVLQFLTNVRSQSKSLKDVLSVQTALELGLEINFDSHLLGSANETFNTFFENGRIRMIGISKHKIRLLVYLLKHSQESIGGTLQVKSIELFRIGSNRWEEVQGMLESFVREPGDVSKKTTQMGVRQAKPTEDVPPQTPEREEIHRSVSSQSPAVPPQGQTGQEVMTQSKPQANTVEGSLQADKAQSQTDTTQIEGKVSFKKQKRSKKAKKTKKAKAPRDELSPVDIKSQRQVEKLDQPENVPLMKESVTGGQRVKEQISEEENEDLNSSASVPEVASKMASSAKPKLNMDLADTSDLTEDVAFEKSNGEEISPSRSGHSLNIPVEYHSKEYKPETLRALRKKVESNREMPMFPDDESDINVLQTVQSLGLHEIIESQCGECHSSLPSDNFVRCLSEMKMLESLILVGTILSPDDISLLAYQLTNLPKLKTLDLRLNQLFDDISFEAITHSLCFLEELTDLRLSLYRVTPDGFSKGKASMKTPGEKTWKRLKTLYLLHGFPAEPLVDFFSSSLKYLHSIECIHVSAASPDDDISEDVLHDVKMNMENPDYVPNLKRPVIQNMESLRSTLAPLKLPKRKKETVEEIPSTSRGAPSCIWNKF